ncbi:MAG: hypothetical protein U0M60_22425 [Clostridia bacterium]|nr:hypothetical protein [Clostridia bacterium]
MIAIDNNGQEYPIINCGDTYIVENSDISMSRRYIDIKSDLFEAEKDDEGYYVIADANKNGSRLVRFKERKDGERIFKQNLMPVFGVKNTKGCFLVIAEGYKYEMNVVFGVKEGLYYIYPRFIIQEQDGIPYENISIRVIRLDGDSDYSDMAVKYREYKLNRKDCIPIMERVKNCPELDYAAQSPEIRIRLGWKPAPAAILEQTVENEPIPKVDTALRLPALKKLTENLSVHSSSFPQAEPTFNWRAKCPAGY